MFTEQKSKKKKKIDQEENQQLSRTQDFCELRNCKADTEVIKQLVLEEPWFTELFVHILLPFLLMLPQSNHAVSL